MQNNPTKLIVIGTGLLLTASATLIAGILSAKKERSELNKRLGIPTAKVDKAVKNIKKENKNFLKDVKKFSDSAKENLEKTVKDLNSKTLDLGGDVTDIKNDVVNYASYTLKDLKKEAKKRGIELDPKALKNDIIKTLKKNS